MATTSRGSGFLVNLVRDHLISRNFVRTSPGSGLRGAVTRFINLMESQLSSAAAINVEEFTNPATADVDAWLTAQATSTAEQVYAADDLDGASAGTELDIPRNVSVTTVGTDDQFTFPMTVEIEGEYLGEAQTETITFASTDSPGTLYGTKPFSKVTGVTISANADTGGTVSVGFGTSLGLGKRTTLKARAGAYAIIREISAGSLVTNGALNQYGLYTPNTVPNGSNDYAIFYEADISAIKNLDAG